jgi:ankyrin repeat protein
MHAAAYHGPVQAMQLLLQHGADINSKPGTPWSNLHRASLDVPLAYAAYNNGVTTIQWMLEQGADAGLALVTASSVGNLPVLGADINTWGGLALRLALPKWHLSTSCLLLGAGPPDYFMSAAPPHPGMEMEDINYCVSAFLQMADEHKALALLQAAVQHGHTVFAQMLQEQGVALPAGQLHGQGLQQEAS